MRKVKVILACILVVLFGIGLVGCGGPSVDEIQNTREVSWEGTELTITLGTNKSTGCEWSMAIQDDSIIDYSINRVFHLSSAGTKQGDAIGTSDVGFKGKAAGTTQIICTTPVGWDGTGEGLTYTVTVTVNEDGTIAEASGE